ncbi:MAG: D-alanyl-D-alanine carboxypeptidase [Aeromonadaceae bacterium]|nr:D-alanyl-D-alanine carboxypeptidase [Aeromonadaceae bacterium]MBP8064657.1 D-alanyl-D-alanine carboxypeptidase [Aeromonadaceae bacterium]MBP9568718.1 D-alanyl-D-alanine carboxypeptidase [Aeromonadaceae bacterium]
MTAVAATTTPTPDALPKPDPRPMPAPAPVALPSPPQIAAKAFLLMDYHTGQILIGNNEHDRLPPASLTKMMTSYVIGQELKNGRIKPDDMVTISQNAWAKNYSDSSKMFIEVGKQVSVDNLNKGIIIQSGNDACIAMAEHIAGSEDSFASLMNQWAERLGMKETHFVNAHGLYNADHYSSAYDMALLGQALIRDLPSEYAIYAQKDFTFNGIVQHNRNRLLWDKTLAVDGIKTGHVSEVGYNLVASATGPDNMRLISVVIGSGSEAQRAEESKKLLTYGFRFYQNVTPYKQGAELATQRIWMGDKSEIKLGTDRDISLVIPRNSSGKLKADFQLKNELNAPIKKGEQVGTIFLKLDGKDVAQYPLVALEEVNEGSLFSRLWDYLVLLFQRLLS